MAETLSLDPTQDVDARLRFTLSDVQAMLAAGVLDEAQRYEVLDGEIVPMMAPNPPHMRAKRWLARELTLRLERNYWVCSEPTFHLELDGDFTIPDIIVYPRAFRPEDVRGPDALLVIEVAHSSLKKDRGRKARLYARFGVRDYWVVDAARRLTWVHRDPADGRYGEVQELGPEAALAPLLLPCLSLRMAEVE